jgi:hypothetical protein
MTTFADPENHQRIIVRGGLSPMIEKPIMYNRYWNIGFRNNIVANPHGSETKVGTIGLDQRAGKFISHDGLTRAQLTAPIQISSIKQHGESRIDPFREQRIDGIAIDMAKVSTFKSNPLSQWSKVGKDFSVLENFYRSSGREQSRFEVTEQKISEKNINKGIDGDSFTTFHGFHERSNPLMWGAETHYCQDYGSRRF